MTTSYQGREWRASCYLTYGESLVVAPLRFGKKKRKEKKRKKEAIKVKERKKKKKKKKKLYNLDKINVKVYQHVVYNIT